MTVAAIIEDKLTRVFRPDTLRVIDESHRHAGHAGARPEGETHFRIEIIAAAFAGQPRVARHRLIYEALTDELAGPVHALALDTRAPGE